MQKLQNIVNDFIADAIGLIFTCLAYFGLSELLQKIPIISETIASYKMMFFYFCIGIICFFIIKNKIKILLN